MKRERGERCCSCDGGERATPAAVAGRPWMGGHDARPDATHTKEEIEKHARQFGGVHPPMKRSGVRVG